MERNPVLVTPAAFEEQLEKFKNGTHRHLCTSCGTLWFHTGAEVKNRHRAHSCPGCGKYIIDMFMNAFESDAIEWDGSQESPKAKLFELRRRDEFEQTKIRRIGFRVYWLTKKRGANNL